MKNNNMYKYMTTSNQNNDWQGGFRSHILNGPNIFSIANYNIKYSKIYGDPNDFKKMLKRNKFIL